MLRREGMILKGVVPLSRRLICMSQQCRYLHSRKMAPHFVRSSCWNIGTSRRKLCMESEEEKPVLIFGLSGTIVDTTACVRSSILSCLKIDKPAITIPDNVILSCLGDTDYFFVKGCAQHAGVDVNVIMPTVVQSFRSNLQRPEMIALTKPIEGAGDALEALKQEGFRMALCTMRSQQLAESILRQHGFLDFFVAIVGGDRLPVYKPDPGHLIAAAAAAGGDEGRAVVVAASPSTIRSAHSAGMTAIAVGPGPAGSWERLQPNAVIGGVGEIGDSLVRLRENSTY